MLMNVAERRREIGVRLAGARPRDIRALFLLEAGALSIAGALLGALLGLLSAYAFAVLGLDVLTGPYSLPLGVGSSLLIGVFFGIHPRYPRQGSIRSRRCAMLEVRLLCGCCLPAQRSCIRPGQKMPLPLARDVAPTRDDIVERKADRPQPERRCVSDCVNRTIQSAYLDRIAQKYDLRVAEDYFNPKLVLGGRYVASKGSVDGTREG